MDEDAYIELNKKELKKATIILALGVLAILIVRIIS